MQKKVWFNWFQGYEKSPYLVKKCYASWKLNNPDWEVIFVTEENFKEYVDLNISEKKYRDMPKCLLSDFLRLQLLKTYGGVWADATCFCMRPLDAWIQAYTGSGFFAFEKPGIDREISSWFLYAEPDNPIIDRLSSRLNDYWNNNKLDNRRKKILVKILSSLLNSRNTKITDYWFSYPVTGILKVYPYYAFHYMFSKLIREDHLCSDIWNETRRISSQIPHKLQNHGLFNPLTEKLKSDIDQRVDPLYKLTWKYDQNKLANETALQYLLDSADIFPVSHTAPISITI